MKKYNLRLGLLLATIVTLAIVPVRLAEGQGANLFTLIGSEIVIWLMCIATWLSGYETYYRLKLVKWQKIAVALLLCAVISNVFFLCSFRMFDDYPLKNMRDLPLWIITIRLSLRGLLLGLIMVPIIFLLESERERQAEALKRERDRAIEAEKQKQVLEVLVAERTADLEEALTFLGESQEELEHQVYLLTRVVASIAHDVHAPLQYIVAATKQTGELISSNELELAAAYNQQVEGGLGNMAVLMHNLLEFARGQIHKDALHSVQVNLATLMREKAALFEQILSSKGNTLQLSLNENVAVVSNAHLLGVILHNLLDNAAKNTVDGQIEISSAMTAGRLYLYIQNPVTHAKSAGISRIGRKSGPRSQFTGQGGDGLGLILVRDISALLNVDFSIEAGEGKVTASIVFPEFSAT
ncbi:sensor histidine kinase [Dyadobacter beijingensis]|nr:HAMP domain-containing sensor histidine kinase [Dyadobacter beijingensis]